MSTLLLLGLGLAAGVLSGLFGIGGGLVVVSALVLVGRWPILQATGTSLGALLLPVGLLGAMEYHRRGLLDIKASALIPLGEKNPRGVLGLGTQDPFRFHPGMGTVYLTRLGEMLTHGLVRHLR